MSKTEPFRTGGSLSIEERESMIKEYLTGNYTKVEIWKKYTGQDKEHGQILSWMRALGYIDGQVSAKRKEKALSLPFQSSQILKSDQPDTDPIELQKRIKELEKQLESAQLKAEGYGLMIDIAERELGLPIRKKSDSE